eukprot:TRINITY_DN18976_c0_g1_i2.p1 TRINITY_DN18976_c0_g1~~TRINITY_DN18976_c0_g1_i2.p1  ORF type:complete len:242 (-),score=-11.25 TRINITY_DN18976_c0_g1_i2:33-758(-)
MVASYLPSTSCAWLCLDVEEPSGVIGVTVSYSHRSVPDTGHTVWTQSFSCWRVPVLCLLAIDSRLRIDIAKMACNLWNAAKKKKKKKRQPNSEFCFFASTSLIFNYCQYYYYIVGIYLSCQQILNIHQRSSSIINSCPTLAKIYNLNSLLKYLAEHSFFNLIKKFRLCQQFNIIQQAPFCRYMYAYMKVYKLQRLLLLLLLLLQVFYMTEWVYLFVRTYICAHICTYIYVYIHRHRFLTIL